MPTGNITKRSVDAFKPGKRDAFLWDDEVPGFGLRVTTAGTKSYVFQYRTGGREARARRMTIGKHGLFTPDRARERAKDLAQAVRSGIDPLDFKREERRQAVDLAFNAYVELFNDAYLTKRWANPELGHRLLKREALPVIGRKPITKVGRADINAVYDRLADRPGMARLAHATLRKLFRFAVARGDLERSPLEGITAPPTVPARDRVLADWEMKLAWNAASFAGAHFTNCIRLLIVTGQRRDEVAGIQWSELDRESLLWTLPATRAKNRQAHLLPLSSLARDIIDEVAGGEKWPQRGFVFSTTGKSPISGFSKAKRRMDEAMAAAANEAAEERGEVTPTNIFPWRFHDLRRTLATGMQRLGVRFEVTEAVLNHVSGSRAGIAGVYQRHTWADEKRSALNAWGAHVAGLVVPADDTNVIPLMAQARSGVPN